MVNGVIIDERISVGNNEISERFSREGRQFGFQIRHKLVGGFLRDAFKIVAEIVASAIFPPVIQCNFFYGFSGFSNYAEPEQGSPNAVFFTDMGGSSAETFFSAESNAVGIHQVNKVFPAGRNFVVADFQSIGDPFDRH